MLRSFRKLDILSK